MESMGRPLIFLGIMIVIIGIIFSFSGKFPFIGSLPGDIKIERESFRFYFPFTTSILISIVFSLILWIWNRL